MRRLQAAGSLAAVVLALISAGCAHGPPARTAGPGAGLTADWTTPAGNWEGRLSLKLDAHGGEAARGASMAFVLQGTPERGSLDLSTPLGTQMAAVTWDAQQAVMQTAEGRTPYASLDHLTRDLLGEALPLRAMMSWLQGRPDPAQPWQPEGGPTAGPTTEVERFQQAGWQVDLQGRAMGLIEARRESDAHRRGAQIKVRLMR